MQQSYQPDMCTLPSSPLFDYYNRVAPPTHGELMDNDNSSSSSGVDLAPQQYISKSLADGSPKSVAAKQKKRSHKYKNDEEKRRKFLERNRQAAVKSRQRKKKLLNELQAKTEYLTADNEQLQIHVCMLREEVISLRQILYAHRDCSATKQQQQRSSELMPPSPASSLQQQPQLYKDSDYYPSSFSGLLQHQGSTISVLSPGVAVGNGVSNQSEPESMIPNTLMLPAVVAQQSTIMRPW